MRNLIGAAAVALATASMADAPDLGLSVHEPDAHQKGSVGLIRHTNLVTWGLEGPYEATVETPVGAFVMRVTITRNDECGPRGCPDTVEMLHAPVGYVLLPSYVSTPENQNTAMHIFPLVGF